MKRLPSFMFVALVLAGALRPGTVGAAIRDVTIDDFFFNPSSVTIQAGDSVRWTQRGDFAHTTTSGVGGVANGLWGSDLLSLNQTFTHQFSTAGTFPYFCVPHFDFMDGSVTVQGAPQNMPPTVQITSPTNGASFAAPAQVTIMASAMDSDGSITRVEFLDGTNGLGSDLTFPYEVTVPLAVGSHVLKAVATDNQGASNTSATVTISVATVPIADPIPARIAKGDITVELQTIADGMPSPMGMGMPDDGSGRMFVYDQAGWVWVIANGARLSTPLLDIRSRLVTLGAYDERGLLGFAVHPNFAAQPLVYTYSSEPVAGAADFTLSVTPGTLFDHQSVVAEWRISVGNSNRVDVASRREILRIDQPQSNHNGGALRFGPDGMLYIALGDGGAADDQGEGHGSTGNGQNLNTVHGSILRIDVQGNNSANGRYGIPDTNPFVGVAGVDEIYAYGFRNPFSFSFDSQTGELYAGDVGQNKIEEIDIVTAGGNYGWNVKEGTFYFDPNGAGAGYVTATPALPVPPGLIDPIAQYDHDDGLAVVGGHVYRGTQVPALAGRYLMGDWGNFNIPSGRLFYLDASRTVLELRLGPEDRPLGMWIKGFGQDAQGEVYVFASRILGPAGNTGRMMKIVPAPDPIAFTSVAAANTNLASEWSGGIGPYALQKRTTLNDPYCVNAAVTTERNATVPQLTKSGFFRVVDTAHRPAVPFTTHMSGLLERPIMLTNSATGSGTFSLDGDTLAFDIQYAGLSGPAINAHIHGPATAAEFGGVMINLAPYNGGSFGVSGTLSGTVLLTPQQKAILLAGRAYVNVHTDANQGGELRGQIAPVLMQACLNSANEPSLPTPSQGTGLGTFVLVGKRLTFNLTYRGLTSTANNAHIHGPTSSPVQAPVLVNLVPFNGGAFGTSGSLQGSVTLTEQQLAYVVDGLTYVNIHTPLNSQGEIRGQIWADSTSVPLTAFMSGLMERPTMLTNSAMGSGTFQLDGSLLTFNVRYDGLSGTATRAHIHGPAAAAGSATVLVDLEPFNGGSFGVSGTLSGSVQLTPAQRNMVLNGQTYVNVHTEANTGGELRGHIAPVLMRASLSGVNERPTSNNSPGTGTALFSLVRDQITMNVTYLNLTGVANNAHIHGPAGLFQTAPPIVDLVPYNGGAFGVSGALFGTAALTAQQLASVIDGLTYVNVHTPANGSGEIRGQITR